MSDNTIPVEKIERVRALIARRMAAFDGLTLATDPVALKDLEPIWFGDLAVVLEHAFTDRSRTVERRDGNPLVETRSIVTSVLENDGRFRPEPGDGLDSSTSVLGLEPGDEVRLRRGDFDRLQEAFFTDLALKFALA